MFGHKIITSSLSAVQSTSKLAGRISAPYLVIKAQFKIYFRMLSVKFLLHIDCNCSKFSIHLLQILEMSICY